MSALALQGQFWEGGAFVGASSYSGDLARRAQEPSEYGLSYGLFGRYNMRRHLSFKLHAYRGEISGTDANSSLASGRRDRNLSFQSDIYEVGGQVEFNLLGFDPASSDHLTTPYLFAGVAGFYYNPMADFGGELVELQPLGTEGQTLNGDDPYSLYQVSFPLGVGFRFSLNRYACIGFEAGARLTLTDYLDDVSTTYPDIDALRAQNSLAADLSFRTPEFRDDINLPNPEGTSRGNPDNDDWYFFGGITVSFYLSDTSGRFGQQRWRRSSRD